MSTAIYLRISEDRQGLELGIDRQREDCLALAAARGWPDPLVFSDNDISATKGKLRPGYQALLAELRAGRVTRVIVYHSSRMWRSRRERADGIEVFRNARAILIACKGPELDMSTAYGRGIAGLVGEFDSMESEVKAERSAREVRQRAERGAHHGGPRAFGYSADGMTLVPGEAKTIAGWYEAFLAGRTITSLAKASGRNYSSVRTILASPRNAGLRVLHGVEYPGAWPAIVSEEVWRATAAKLTDPARRTNTSNIARRWMGSGFYRCERCGGKPVSSSYTGKANGARRVYVCLSLRGGCSRTWDATKLDDYITDLVAIRLSLPDLDDLLAVDRPDLAEVRAERTACRARLDRLAEDWAVGELTDAQLRAATTKLKARLAELDAVAASAEAPAALSSLLAAEDRAALWLSIPPEQVDRKQAILRALLTVTLGPSPRGRAPYDPGVFVHAEWLGTAP